MGRRKFITAKVINESLRLALRERDATRAIELFLEHMGEKSHCERIYIVEGERDVLSTIPLNGAPKA